MSDTINLLVLEGDGISPEITAATLNADYAVAQAQHGSAPDTAGQNVANPSSLIGSAAMPLAWLGEGAATTTGSSRRRRASRPPSIA